MKKILKAFGIAALILIGVILAIALFIWLAYYHWVILMILVVGGFLIGITSDIYESLD